MDNHIGAQFFTIRDYCQTLDDFDSSCKKVSEIGYKNVQLSGIGDFEGKDIKKILDKYNLKVVCTHRPPANYLENIEREIEFHKAIGCNICGIGAMPGLNVEDETVSAFIENFSVVCEKLRKHNLVFAYHNHAFEFEKKNNQFVFDILTNGIKCDNFKFILDVYWLSYAGINPSKFIRERKGKIACVHFKDLAIKNNVPCYSEIGNGNLDWNDIISACEEAEVEFAVVEQDICDGDPFESLKISYDFLLTKNFI